MKASCELCGAHFTRTGMTRHLESCLSAHASAAQSAHTAGGGFHLQVQGKYDKTYWLHLHAPGDATLDDVDVFLRGIWLECCGHMSEFTRVSAGRSRAPWDELDLELEQDPSLTSILKRGDKLDYTYDFGSSTRLTLTVTGPAPPLPQVGASKIRLLARNPPPELPCRECGNPATRICIECSWSGPSEYCDPCLDSHPCGEEMALPVVNSPRVGVCAYTGPES